MAKSRCLRVSSFADLPAALRAIQNAELVDLKRIGKEVVPVARERDLVSAYSVPAEPYANLLVMLREAHLPEPVREYPFASPADRRFAFDYAWVRSRVALEIEGGIWRKGGGAHSHPKGILRDIEKYNLATILGWRVLRSTPDQFVEAVRNVACLLGPDA